MNQMTYILYACFIIIVTAISYSFIKPLTATTLFPTEENKLFCGTASMPSIEVTTAYPVGKKLFQQNCQSCHTLNKNLTGPALGGFVNRGPWSNEKNIYDWIHNPAAFIKKNKYTQQLQLEYGVIMPAFPELSEKEIDDIVAYLNE